MYKKNIIFLNERKCRDIKTEKAHETGYLATKFK